MLGVLVATLVEFVEARGGEALRAQLCESAGMAAGEKVRLDVEYDDAMWQRLYPAALARIGELGPVHKSPAEVEREYAFFAGDWLADKFRGLIHGATTAREVMWRQPVIHNTLGRAHRSEATRQRVADKFKIQEKGNDLLVTYSSPNNHPGLYLRLADWVADKFQERIDVTHTEQKGNGQPVHVFHIRFLGKRTPGD